MLFNFVFSYHFIVLDLLNFLLICMSITYTWFVVCLSFVPHYLASFSNRASLLNSLLNLFRIFKIRYLTSRSQGFRRSLLLILLLLLHIIINQFIMEQSFAIIANQFYRNAYNFYTSKLIDYLEEREFCTFYSLVDSFY